MIYLSYFNNPKVRESGRRKYSVARSQFVEMPKAEELLLNIHDFKAHKSGKIDFKELCTRYYFNELEKLNAQDILEKYDEAILCCHEVEGCHRDIIKYWLNINNIDAQEYRK